MLIHAVSLSHIHMISRIIKAYAGTSHAMKKQAIREASAMKLRNLVLIIMVVFTMLFMQGCSGVWSFDFTKTRIGGWSYRETELPATKTLNSTGLIMSGITARSFWGFKGDIEMEVIFELHNIFVDNRIDEFSICLGDGNDLPAQCLALELTDIGGMIFENCVVKLNGSYKAAHLGVEGLLYDDVNSLVISIQGGVCNIAMNGTSLCPSFNMGDYTAELLVPYLFVQQGDPPAGAEKITIKSINVESSESRESV